MPGGQVMSPSAWPDGRGAVLDGDLEDLVARAAGWVAPGGRIPGLAGPRAAAGSGREAADLAGDGVQHAGGGDPALHVLAVGGQHRQPVAAVGRELAQSLGEGLAGEDRLRVALVGDRPGQPGQGRGPRRPVAVRGPAGDGERVPGRGAWRRRRSGRRTPASGAARSMSLPRRSSLVV